MIDLNDHFTDYDVSVVLSGTTLEISSVLNWNGVTAVSLTAADEENRYSVTDEFNLTVTSVNDAPYVEIPLDDLYLDEDFAEQLIDLDANFSDPDNALTYYGYADAGEITIFINENILSLNSIDDNHWGIIYRFNNNIKCITYCIAFIVILSSYNNC